MEQFDALEIDFVIQMKHLTDAGYNVPSYDIRNHGNSGAANGGLSGVGSAPLVSSPSRSLRQQIPHDRAHDEIGVAQRDG